MYSDGRSRKIVFIAHCFLNQNTISDGTAIFPAAFREVVDFFLDRDISIYQMPCPEFTCLGLDRGNKQGADYPVTVENTRIRHEMENPCHNEKLNKLSSFVVSQIKEYADNGFEIIGIIGANRSPNCGVDTTSDFNIEIEGMGLFMNKLCSELEKQNIKIPFVGLKSSDDINAKFSRILK